MQPGSEATIWSELGEHGCRELVSAFYDQVRTDDLLGPMYRRALEERGEDMASAEARLRDFLAFRLGGSQKYIQERGHPRLRARHLPFPIDQSGAERWLTLMDRAMDGLTTALSPDSRTQLRSYFAQTAAFMVNRA